MQISGMLPPLLRMAIKAGSLETVKAAIKQGVDPNISDAEGNSLLISALRSKQFHICQFLLENGASPEAKSNSGVSAADLAIEIDDENKLQLWKSTTNSIQKREIEQVKIDDWIAEEEITLPPSETSVFSQVIEYQNSISQWELIDRDTLWEDVDIDFLNEVFDKSLDDAFYKATLNIAAKANIYGVIDPIEIQATLEAAGLEEEIENRDLLHTAEFIIESLGFAVDICSDSGYYWPSEMPAKNINDPDWNSFFRSIYHKKITSLSLLQRTLQKSQTISKEEEKSLFEALKSDPSNAKVREKIITANLRFAYKTAIGYSRNCAAIGLEDRISEAIFGLIIALEKFEIDRELKFISYAVHWIRQRILKYYADHEHNIRIPANKLALISRFKRDVEKNNSDYEKLFSLPEYTDSAKEISELLMMSEVSIEAPIDGLDESEAPLFCDCIGVEACQEDEADNALLKSILDRVLDGLLPEREAKILRMYYGINYSKEFTYDEIGRELNLTRERIRQIHNKCLNKLLKNKTSSELLFPFIGERAGN